MNDVDEDGCASSVHDSVSNQHEARDGNNDDAEETEDEEQDVDEDEEDEEDGDEDEDEDGEDDFLLPVEDALPTDSKVASVPSPEPQQGSQLEAFRDQWQRELQQQQDAPATNRAAAAAAAVSGNAKAPSHIAADNVASGFVASDADDGVDPWVGVASLELRNVRDAESQLWTEPRVAPPEHVLHVADLPTEVLTNVLAYLRPESVEAFARVCRHWWCLARQSFVWRRQAAQRFGPDFVPHLTRLLPRYNMDWRRLFIEVPRLCMDGIYVARISYVRPTGSVGFLAVATPTFLVEYYRYFKFFKAGHVLYSMSFDDPWKIPQWFHRDNVGLDLGHNFVSLGSYEVIRDPVLAAAEATVLVHVPATDGRGIATFQLKTEFRRHRHAMVLQRYTERNLETNAVHEYNLTRLKVTAFYHYKVSEVVAQDG